MRPCRAAHDGVEDHLVVELTLRDGQETITNAELREALAQGKEILKDLLRALRLFGDGRVALGALAWTRVGDSAWESVRPRAGRDGRTACSW